MNAIIAFLMLLVWMVAPAKAADVLLSWNPNSESDLAGYKLYRSTVSGQYGAPVATLGKVTSTTLTLPQLETDATYYFALTAYDLTGNESDKSAEVRKLVAGVSSIPVTPPSVTLTLHGDPAVEPWAVLASIVNAPASPYSVDVYVNGALDHTENADPRCVWGDDGTVCAKVLKPAGTYVLEFRLMKNAVEVARQSLTVVVPDRTAPAAPTGFTVN